MMSTNTSPASNTAPIKKTVEVAAPRAIAFRVFTDEMTSWWELESHHIGKANAVATVIEPFVGGRWYERGDDGTECSWGKVLAWEPPQRVLLAWQISAAWQFDERVCSEVEVRFIEVDAATTRVELEHRLLDTYGDKAAEIRSTYDSPGGWTGILSVFAAAAAARARA